MTDEAQMYLVLVAGFLLIAAIPWLIELVDKFRGGEPLFELLKKKEKKI